MTGEELSSDLFRQAMGRLPAGVTVVTTLVRGHDHAMTASAVVSVSLEPMLVLLSVEEDARFHDAVAEAGVWGVSVLGASQRRLAAWLSVQGRPMHGQLDRIDMVRGPATGVALLSGSLATIECRTTAVHPAGDHSIVLGEVQSVAIDDDPDAALVYHRGRFGTVG